MKRYLALALAFLFYLSILPAWAAPPNASFNTTRTNDIITKGPWVDVRAYNTALTGTAIQNALDNATAGDTVRLNQHTTYSVTSPIYITKRINFDLNGSTLQATGTTDSILQVGNGSTFQGPVQISNGVIDGNGKATDGIKVTTSYNLSMRSLRVINNTHGINMYGAAGLSMTSINGYDITTNRNLYGLYLDMAGNNASFAQFTFTNLDAGDNTACVYSKNGSTGLILIGGDSQPQDGGDGILLDNSTITLVEHYIEPFPGHKSLDLINSSVASVFGGQIYGHTTDNTSKVISNGYSYNNGSGRTSTSSVMGYMSDTLTTDTVKWGGPYWPDKGRSGATVQKGFRFTDDYGVVWTATTGGHAASAARFSAMDGRIIIPISYNTYGNGSIVWFPEEDFVITHLSFVVTDTWVGGTDIGIYQAVGAVVTYYIDLTQGAPANLIDNTVIMARNSTSADNILAGGNKEVLLPGVQVGDSGATGRSGVRWATHGTWSAGTGIIVIRGYYLKYN